ncbi:hypothetical protein CCC_00109 [Paramagnetospirillum magnetotacticum MS-1]|uniref:Uncharacterized protein n=1 Tax=Paramagnetospirillum magnetotacticum MS-1 TaxID=272627 RepID=A0A0C2YPI7_PARME|nr:ankyrin repeat domain-containing protein [Paramagnetospirillum magnetotacticum]KIL97048.1 hypothetical protein CCC_00109 [Paramagnetospirillum magnetotacticum MS-1]
MSKHTVVAAACALLLAAGTGAWFLSGRAPASGGDELAALPGDGLVTFARIQTEMNRAGAGRSALPADANADKLEAIGGALREFLAGNTVKASNILDDIDAEIELRVPTDEQVAADPLLADKEEWLVSYFELLPDAPQGKGVKADTYVFIRYALSLRKVEAILLAETMPSTKGYDLVARKTEPEPSVFDGMNLRFPCRMAASHRALLEETAKRLGPLMGGPLTDCPTPKGREADFNLLERIARDPAGALTSESNGHGHLPRDLKTPLMTAAAKGSLTDIEKVLKAGADPHRADARGRTALHYLLGNSGLKPEERTQAVKLLY